MSDPIRILVVDDEEAFAVNLTRLLHQRGFDVDTAFNGTQALEKVARQAPFHVIVLDVKMPGMDGIRVLKKVKETSPQTEVLMLTGHATLENGIQAMREGAFDYLMKPCEIEDLCEKIMAAYEVESIQRHPVLWTRNLVKEIQNPSFIRLETRDPVQKALEIFSREPGTVVRQRLYVLDEEDRLRGLITKRDLIRTAQQTRSVPSLSWEQLVENPDLLPPVSVQDVMQHTLPAFTDPDENLSEVAERMIAENVRSMPVVKEGRFAGIIRLQDILRHIEQEIA